MAKSNSVLVKVSVEGRKETLVPFCPGASPVMVISHSLWQRRFGAANVIGRAITLNGTPFTIIGVAPDSFYAVESGVWFTASRLTGPWIVAQNVPSVIYSIPASSPLHYVTYVHVYGATPQTVPV